MSIIIYDVLSPVPSLPTTVVPASMVKVAPSVTATRPSSTQILSALNVVSEVMFPAMVSFSFTASMVLSVPALNVVNSVSAESPENLLSADVPESVTFSKLVLLMSAVPFE